MLFSIVKWYLIVVSVYFVVFYFCYMLTTSKRDRVFPSLLEVVNHIRENDDNQGNFFNPLVVITIIYSVISALVLFASALTGKL